MGTIEQFVSVLHKITDDRKARATERFLEHSDWLQNEFLLLQRLIERDPRSNEPIELQTSETEPKEERDFVEIETEGVPETAQGLKRKSPEICLDGQRNSPEAKRSSADYAELAVKEGLPADLNKLKKEQLLEELERRGITTVSNKALKKDLIEILKNHLVNNKNHCGESLNKLNSTEQLCKNVSVVENEYSSTTSTTSQLPRQPRQGSILMSEFRNKSQPTALTATSEETDADRQARVEKGFNERMGRHRDSQIRKSQIMVAAAALGVTANAIYDSLPPRTDIPDDVTKETEENEPLAQNIVPTVANVYDVDDSTYEPSPASSPQPPGSDLNSSWMDVSSPVHASANIEMIAYEPTVDNSTSIQPVETSAASTVAINAPQPTPANLSIAARSAFLTCKSPAPERVPVKTGFVAATIKTLFSPGSSNNKQTVSVANPTVGSNINIAESATQKARVSEYYIEIFHHIHTVHYISMRALANNRPSLGAHRLSPAIQILRITAIQASQRQAQRLSQRLPRLLRQLPMFHQLSARILPVVWSIMSH